MCWWVRDNPAPWAQARTQVAAGIWGGGRRQRQGTKPDADLFRILQYPKRTGWRNQVGNMREGPDQPGSGNNPGNETDRESLHLRFERIHNHHFRHTEPTRRQSGGVLPRLNVVFSRGTPEVWSQRHRIPSRDGRLEMVYHWMLSHPI